MPPQPTPPKGWARHLSHPSDPAPGHTSILNSYKKPACPTSWSGQAGEFVVYSYSRGPDKALPGKEKRNFSVTI